MQDVVDKKKVEEEEEKSAATQSHSIVDVKHEK